MPYCCKNWRDELLPAIMVYLERCPLLRWFTNQEAKTEGRVVYESLLRLYIVKKKKHTCQELFF